MLVNSRVAFASVALVVTTASAGAQIPVSVLPEYTAGPRVVSAAKPTIGRTLDSLMLARRRFANANRSTAQSGSQRMSEQSLSGPRVGMIYFENGITRIDDADNRETTSNLMTIFGWQFEDRSFELDNGFAGMTEFVASVAGIDQHLLLPALSLMMAVRTPGGAEFGIGPTVSPTEINITLGGGFTIDAGQARFPINVALVPSRTGARVSLTTGWIISH